MLQPWGGYGGVKTAQKTTKRVVKKLPSQSKIWKEYKSVGKGRRTSGTGKKQQYYEWDYTHGDIEMYNSKGKHMGSVHPETGLIYKPAVKGRKIKL